MKLIPSEPSLAYDQIIEGIVKGKIRGLWVLATNPAHSWINQDNFSKTCSAGSSASSSKTCTTTPKPPGSPTSCCPPPDGAKRRGPSSTPSAASASSRRVARAPGQALADFSYLPARGRGLGLRRFVPRVVEPRGGLSDPETTEPRPAVRLHGHRRLCRDRLGGRIQWPLPVGAPLESKERRLFEDGHFFTPDGRAKFFFSMPRPLPETTSDNFRFCFSPDGGARASGTRKRARSARRCCRSSPRAHSTSRCRRPTPRSSAFAPMRWFASRRRGRQFQRERSLQHGAAGPGLHADALRDDEPPHLPGVRSAFAAARVQGMRREGLAHRARATRES